MNKGKKKEKKYFYKKSFLLKFAALKSLPERPVPKEVFNRDGEGEVRPESRMKTLLVNISVLPRHDSIFTCREKRA